MEHAQTLIKLVLFLGILTIPRTLRAQTPTPPPLIRTEAHGYLEAFFQVNTNLPSNNLTHYRGYDNRAMTFMLSNAVVDLTAEHRDRILGGRIALQIGTTPETYYLSEPLGAGTAGTGALSFQVWKYVQQAFLTFRPPIRGNQPLAIEIGLFLSPLGPEGMAIKDNWNWSRSNLFVGLPFYHLGGRATYQLTERWSLTAGIWNGWNNLLDNNLGKSFHLQATYAVPDRFTWSFIYFTGIERTTGAPEGQPWRHTWDMYVTWHPRPWISLQAWANGGLEPNTFGIAGWMAGALYARVQPTSWLYLGARADAFYEQVPTGASPISWPVPWLASATATVDVRPHPNASIRLEYRYDAAGGPLFFAGTVAGDGSALRPFLPNAATQQTVTLGVTAWL